MARRSGTTAGCLPICTVTEHISFSSCFRMQRMPSELGDQSGGDQGQSHSTSRRTSYGSITLAVHSMKPMFEVYAK